MIQFIIARYNENIDWLLPFTQGAFQIHVQNKGDPATLPHVFSEKLKHTHKNLPNVGLDQHSFLDFIVDNYGPELPDKMLFMQAGLMEHLDSIEPATFQDPVAFPHKKCEDIDPRVKHMDIDTIINILCQQLEFHGHTLNAKVYGKLGGDICVRYNLKVTINYDEEDTGLLFGPWFEKNIKPSFPDENKFLWFKNGIFGVSKKHVLCRPKSYYEELLRQSAKALRGEVLHYIERSWYYIFNLDFPEPFSYRAVIPKHINVFHTLDHLVVASGQPFVEGSLFFFGNQDMTYNDVFLHKQYNLFQFARKAKSILEIGFNAGHSTALMLLANPTSKILHFDIKEHAYVDTCYEYLKSVFGADRFLGMTQGDSKATLPAWISATNPASTKQPPKSHPYSNPTLFDIIHIDGGHNDIDAISDIYYCKKLAHKDTIVIIDDYNMPNIKKVVDNYINKKYLHADTNIPVLDYYGDKYHYIGKYTFDQ